MMSNTYFLCDNPNIILYNDMYVTNAIWIFDTGINNIVMLGFCWNASTLVYDWRKWKNCNRSNDCDWFIFFLSNHMVLPIYYSVNTSDFSLSGFDCEITLLVLGLLWKIRKKWLFRTLTEFETLVKLDPNSTDSLWIMKWIKYFRIYYSLVCSLT